MEELKQPEVDLREALAKLSEMEASLQQQQSQYNVEVADAQLAAVGEALSLAEPLAAAGKALSGGQFDKAAEELAKAELIQFPTVMGGIVPVVNLEGIKGGELTIDGPTLAKIYLGEIKTWDDAAIKKLNPSAKLPSQAIALVHRPDGSGTTFIFTNDRSKGSADL